ncbi:hypothetical protein IQ07DRAFT_28151 [Pyrenochaeta sp. DS3sAY3a]|nr:hypothetical protein IQ07DRAFT_28151 [Pyrenochaeta sp. DS3sAY3a]
MSQKPILLILGSGPRIGASLTSTFTPLYTVALASRRGTNTLDPSTGILSLAADLTQPSSVPGVFAAVHAHLHRYPSVVIYNAAALTNPAEQGAPLSVPLDRVLADLNVNVVSPFVAAQEAVKGWEKDGESGSGEKKTFIYTGNILNTTIMPVPMLVNLGVGKAASAFWIGVSDASYKAKGYRFFYADERKADGNSKGNDISGPAHGDFYKQLTEHVDVPWHATFVEGKGYVKF